MPIATSKTQGFLLAIDRDSNSHIARAQLRVIGHISLEKVVFPLSIIRQDFSRPV
jgi:hypothetical protein